MMDISAIGPKELRYLSFLPLTWSIFLSKRSQFRHETWPISMVLTRLLHRRWGTRWTRPRRWRRSWSLWGKLQRQTSAIPGKRLRHTNLWADCRVGLNNTIRKCSNCVYTCKQWWLQESRYQDLMMTVLIQTMYKIVLFGWMAAQAVLFIYRERASI